MVVIIDGEIVPDDDPRAKNMRRTGAPAASTQRPAAGAGGGGFGSVQGAGAGSGVAPPGGPGGWTPPDGPDGLLTPVSRALGIEGRVVTTPAFAGVAPQSFPLVMLVVAAGLGLLAGPQFALAFALLYWVYVSNRDQPAAAATQGAQ